MASSGKDAWLKHFKGKGNVNTVMKTKSPLLDGQGKSVGYIDAGESIIAIQTSDYATPAPIEYKGKRYQVTFNNIQKPKSKLVSGIKLKPQDFASVAGKENFQCDTLVSSLISDIDDRTDLDPALKTYLTALTKYWGKVGGVTANDVRAVYTDIGLNEVQKDYGELLGAIACVKHKILAPNVKISSAPTIIIPLRGNEPLVDYYLKDASKKYSISAKSGTTTNTLKPADVLTLLETKGLMSKYNNTKVKRMLEMITEYPTAKFPWASINEVHGKTILSDAAMKTALSWKVSDFPKNDYDPFMFADLMSIIKIPKTGSSLPRIGELFYYTEKYIIGKANTDANPTQIFKDATSGMVIYVKYSITTSSPTGEFSVMMSELQGSVTKVTYRSKNSTNRAADKVGLQP